MAAHVDRHGQPRDVRGHSLNIHAERGGTPAEALRADAEGVYPLQQLPLHRGVVFIRVRLIYRAQQRMLCKLRDLIKAAADADTEYNRRAGVRPGKLHGFDNEVLDAIRTVRRLEHFRGGSCSRCRSPWGQR